MYNTKQKESYISYKEFSTVMPKGFLKGIFEYTGVSEELLSKDIMDFNRNEITNLYNSVKTGSEQRLIVLNSALSLYTDWCIEQGLKSGTDNPFRSFEADDFDKFVDNDIKKARFFSKETIYDMIDCIENPGEKFFLLALYEGIGGANLCELVDLRTTDIHGNTITLRNAYNKKYNTTRDIVVSNKLIGLAYMAAAEDVYYKNVKSPDVGINCRTVDFIKDDTLILKNLPNTKLDVSEIQLAHRLAGKLKRIKEVYGTEHLTCSSIINSGKINFIKEHAMELNITPEKYLFSDAVNIVNNQFGCTVTRSRFYRENKPFLNHVA